MTAGDTERSAPNVPDCYLGDPVQRQQHAVEPALSWNTIGDVPHGSEDEYLVAHLQDAQANFSMEVAPIGSERSQCEFGACR